MSFTFRPAVRSAVGVLVGIAGASGAGKTFSALRLAKGMAGDKRFCLIDTEAGRAKHYADQFEFDHGDLGPPFTPARYAEAIKAADDAGYPVIVVDSMSHSWAGTGGVLDMQEAEFERMGGRESAKMASWIKPKGQQKAMVAKLLQVRAHLILCFRAEEKIDMVKGDDGKIKVVPKQGPGGFKGWLPICDKTLPYELTASFLLLAEAPGIPHPIKLMESHRSIFPLDRPITEESGRKLAHWAAGGAKPSAPAAHSPSDARANVSDAPSGADLAFTPNTDPLLDLGDQPPSQCLTVDQVIFLTDRCREHGINTDALSKAAGVRGVGFILQSNFHRADQWIDKQIERRKVKA